MTEIALESLSLTAFRGSSTTFTLPFEKGRKLTLVYGENGTGKTTICDALELLASGIVGSLSGKGLAGSLEKHWPSKGKSLSDIKVALEIANGPACTGRFVVKTLVVEPENARPRIELLRQQKIKALTEARAGERYTALEQFIDVAAVEKSEGTLRKLVGELDDDRKRSERDELASFASLQGLFEAAGKPAGMTTLSWAKELIAQPQADAEAELKAVDQLRVAKIALGAYPELLAQRLVAITNADTAFQESEAAMQSAVVSASMSAPDTVKLLEAGKAFLHGHPDSTVCPLCESEEKFAGLAESIESRLTQLAAVQQAQGTLDKDKVKLERAKGELTQLETNFTKSREGYVTAKSDFAWGTKYTFPLTDPPVAVGDVQQWLNDAEVASKSWADGEAALRQGSERIAAVKTALGHYETNSKRKAQAETLVPKVQAALELCVAKRQSFIDKIMAEIAQQVGELYEMVHKGEGLAKIALYLDPKQRASVLMQASFSGTDVPPAAYFSQSHLDTLGLCVFLALALRDKPNEKILILDDVLGSVDEPHVERVIDMLYEISQQFRHTIITTHYRPWREKFRWGRLKPDKLCQFVELVDSGIGGVIATRNAKPEIAWLKKYLLEEEKDLQTICGKAGVILEEVLDYLTWLYACHLPRREGAAYTLGELLDATRSKLWAVLKIDVIVTTEDGQESTSEVKLQPILEELSGISNIRNVVGAHFNKLAFVMPEADTLKFARLVEKLADALVCPEHGWPSKNKSGSYWSNGGDTRRLFPIIKPS